MRTSHPSMHTRRRMLAIVAAAVVLTMAGCRKPETAHQDLRGSISAALSRAGHTSQADVVGSDDSTLTSVPAPTLTRWRVIEVSEDRGPHPVLFHVGVAGRQALLLTGRPGEFNRMTVPTTARSRTGNRQRSSSRQGNGFSAEVYAMRNGSLQRRDLTIGTTQSASEKVETLAADLPTPYAR